MLVDAEWSECHLSAIGPFTYLLEVIVEMVNLRPAGSLGKIGESLVGKGKKCDVVPIAYWCYGSSKPSSPSSTGV
jgi:hypothetical protein